MSMKRFDTSECDRTFRAGGVVLGIGLGGFVDGIVAHQLLEWHHMLSSWHPLISERNMRLNMVGDGLFHLVCLVLTVIGIALLNRSAGPRSGRRLIAWILAGWGVFNLVEGIVDHVLLGVHHVHSGPNQLLYDLGFLVLGGVLLGIGVLLRRTGSSAEQRSSQQEQVQR
jgi:uncharacterized membrane protein